MAKKAKVCSLCQKEYKSATCPSCTETGVDVKKVLESEKAQMEKNEAAVPTAFLVDLVSNRKIPITTPRCRVGRDDLNDIVISGDQSISRFHFIITYENGQYQTQDAKSRHGTFLNGNQIGGPEPINDGDVLKIGVSLFWFVIESQAGAEKDEPLPPVDVEKAPGAEELSLKKGGDREHSYSGEMELSATQEISIISPEQLAQYSLTKQAEENEFEAKHEVEPIESEKAASKAADDEKTEKSDSEKKEDEAKSTDSESAKSEDKESKEEPAKSSDAEKTSSRESKKDSEDEEDKAPKSESNGADKPSEPTKDEESKGDEIASAVKELLEPLQDEIAASREMIRDALKKGEMSFDTEESKKDEDEKKEPEQAAAEEEKPEAPKEDDAKSPETVESDDKEKKEEPSQPDSDSEDEKAEPESSSEKESEEPESSAKKDKGEDEKSEEAETLERIAEIIDDSTAKSDLAEKSEDKAGVSADRIETTLASDHDKATNGFSEDIGIVMGPSSVPDWCKRYFSDELKHLNKELDTLNDQIKQYQDKIRKIEGQAAQTKGLRNTLLTADGDDLIEACKQVLGLAGWKVTQSDEDKHEFLLEREDEKVAIARVISIKGPAERSHLGQLSISQTRYWCEKGIEPKGVLIVGRISDKSPKDRGDDTNAEVNEYANMKNVCLMNTLQLLAIYRDLALKDGKSSELRNAIHESKGWLKGFDIEPGDESADEDEKESSKSKSLSSLLSA